MARKPREAKKAASTSEVSLRKRSKIDYNEHKLAVKAATPKVVAPKKKAVVTKKTAKGKAKKGVNYFTLIKRSLKNVEAPGWSVAKLVDHLASNFGKDNRRYVRAALASGVEQKVFVKTRGSYRLSKKAQEKLKKKKARKATKKAATTKKTTKKATTKKATTKKTTKKSATTKKASTKKSATKKSTKKATKETPKKKRATKKEAKSPKPPKKAKKVIAPPADETTEAPVPTEAKGQWQYWDAGWQNYPEASNNIVDGLYKEYGIDGIELRPIKSGHFSYMISFKDNEQRNTETGTVRKIRRT